MRTRELQRRIERLSERINAGRNVCLCLASLDKDGCLSVEIENGILRFANVDEMNKWAEAVGLDGPIVVVDLWGQQEAEQCGATGLDQRIGRLGERMEPKGGGTDRKDHWELELPVRRRQGLRQRSGSSGAAFG